MQERIGNWASGPSLCPRCRAPLNLTIGASLCGPPRPIETSPSPFPGELAANCLRVLCPATASTGEIQQAKSGERVLIDSILSLFCSRTNRRRRTVIILLLGSTKSQMLPKSPRQSTINFGFGRNFSKFSPSFSDYNQLSWPIKQATQFSVQATARSARRNCPSQQTALAAAGRNFDGLTHLP